jgi:uncharacterized membrane protein YccC
MAQFDLLSWVSCGCEEGSYEDPVPCFSACLPQSRPDPGGGPWPGLTAKITAEGTRLLKEQGRRVEAERERARQEEQARAEQARESQRLRARAREVLEAVTAAGGRLALDADYSERKVTQLTDAAGRDRRVVPSPSRRQPVLYSVTERPAR